MSTLQGMVLVFGIVLLPLYAVVISWVVGRPREPKTALIGVGYLLGFIVLAIGGLFVAQIVYSLIL